MPRPFGAWAPALSMAELKARTPRPWHFRITRMLNLRDECFYSPEAMAWFKDPQQYKDAVDTCRKMKYSFSFFGDGNKQAHNQRLKIAAIMGAFSIVDLMFMRWIYASYLPANNPSWRKVMNKEWEEAINNSPWDHRSHVWQYCDVYAASLGDIIGPGQRKFYIPA